MKIFRGIIGTLITVYVRIWIINKFFAKGKNIRNIILIFILSLLSVSILYFYKDILVALGFNNLYFADNMSTRNIFCFLFYCISFLLIINLVLGNIKKIKNIDFIIISFLLFLGIAIGGTLVGMNTMIMYYMISCYPEEILKFSVGQNSFEKNKFSKNNADLILFSILSGLGFSTIENIFYLIILSTSGESLMLSFGRSIFTTLLHVVSTGLVAFFVVKGIKKNNKYRLKCLIGIICGFGLHFLFNFSLNSGYKILTILILIFCYFILTYLLFNCDILYKKDK